MVVSVTPLFIGNALRVQVAPPDGTLLIRLLRNTTNVFTDQDDSLSVEVSESNQEVIIDSVGLTNGTQYFYQAFYWDGLEWSTDVGMYGVPASTYVDGSTDALTLLISRLHDGIKNEIVNGSLTPSQNANGVIDVLSAPPVYENTQFPVVSLHLESESPADHGIGEMIDSDQLDIDGRWISNEGWLAKTTINITGWALNPDERIALRKSIRRLMLGNLPVLYAASLRSIELSQSDVDFLDGQYGAPVYCTVCTFNCLSPLIVGGKIDPVTDVEVDMTVDYVPFNESVSIG